MLFDVYSKCADAAANGQVEAVTTDNVILAGLVSTSQGAFKLVNKPFTKEPYGIGITKGDTEFRTFINDTPKASDADELLCGHRGHRAAQAARRRRRLPHRADRPGHPPGRT